MKYNQKVTSTIIKMKELGHSSRTIAAMLNISKSGVNDALSRAAIAAWPLTGGKENSTPKSILFIPDCQVKPTEKLDYLTAIGLYIAEEKPDIIVSAGDFWDFPSLSSYDKGKTSFEGRRLKDDIEIGKIGMQRMLSPMRFMQLMGSDYNPRMVFTLGNHECVKDDTEILTVDGWKTASSIQKEDLIASYSLEDESVRFDPAISIAEIKDQKLVSVNGDFSKEVVSITHRIDLDNKLTPVSDFIDTKINQSRFRYSVNAGNTGISLSDNDIKLLTWVVMDATLVKSSEVKMRVQFKLSKERKITRLTQLLTEMNVPFTLKECKKSGLNKLQPFYIRIYGDAARTIFSQLNMVKQLPPDWKYMSKAQVDIFLSELSETDGHRHFNKISWSSTNLSDIETIQYACIMNSVAFKFSVDTERSGFTNGKPQYMASIASNGLHNRRYVKVEALEETGTVIAIQTENGTLITRRNGTVAFTGNCRLQRIPENNSEFEGFIGYDLLELEKDWEVYDFLKPVEIQGIFFVHYLANPMTGKPYGGSALNQLKAVGKSFVVGHKQTLDVAFRPTIDGKMQLGIIAGASYPFDEGYKGYQGNNHFRGVVMLKNAIDGFAEPSFISTDTLLTKAGFCYN